MCDVGSGPYDAGLPFLIEWTTPMPPGPADGPVVPYVTLTPPDPDRVADLLLALGFVAVSHWPRRVFRDPDGVGITLLPVEEPGAGRRRRRRGGARATSLALELPVPEVVQRHLDGVAVTVAPDRRRFGAARCSRPSTRRSRAGAATWPTGRTRTRAASPRLEEEYSRVLRPGPLPAARGAGRRLGGGGRRGRARAPRRRCRRRRSTGWASRTCARPGRPCCGAGTAPLPVVVAWAPMEDADDAFVLVGVGEPAHVLDRQPDCGCDACDTGSADLLSTVDDAFVLALCGGVHVVREGDRVVTRALNGWSATGVFGRGEEQRWLDGRGRGAAYRRRRPGEPWLWRRPGDRRSADAAPPGCRQAIVMPPSTGSVWPVM